MCGHAAQLAAHTQHVLYAKGQRGSCRVQMLLTYEYGERQAHIEHETMLEISDSRWHRSTYPASGELWPNTPIPLKPTAKGMGF